VGARGRAGGDMQQPSRIEMSWVRRAVVAGVTAISRSSMAPSAC